MGFRLLSWLLALAGAGVVLYLGSPTEDVYWSDFNQEAWPAFERLLAGDVAGFLARSPVGYGGSMLLRAPFALLGHGEPGVFRLGALPCVLALAALAVYLAARSRHTRWWPLVLALAAASPLAWKAVWFGHPEELLTTALAIGAVLTAISGRALTAGALLGLAVASKQWAIVAVLPVLLAAPRHHVRLLAAAAAAGAALLAPVLLADPAAFAAAQKGVASSARWFNPHQLWWPLGPDAALPALAKPLIVALTLPLAALWAGRRGPRHDALLLLALLLLARCALDPWNTIYYHLPLVVALLAWEVADGRRIPILSLAATGAVWLCFETYGAVDGAGPWLAYMAWTVPLAAVMARRLYGRAKVPAATPA